MASRLMRLRLQDRADERFTQHFGFSLACFGAYAQPPPQAQVRFAVDAASTLLLEPPAERYRLHCRAILAAPPVLGGAAAHAAAMTRSDIISAAMICSSWPSHLSHHYHQP